MAAIPAGPFTGLDAATGAVLWTNDQVKATWSSPVFWRTAGKTYFVVRDGYKLICVEPKPGTVIWSVSDFSPDMTYSGMTPAIEGDRLVIGGKGAVKLYKLTLERAELLWSVDCPTDYCCSPTICNGRVYVFGRGGGTCIDADTGKVVWQDKEIKVGCYTTPLLADGKAFLQGAKQGSMVDGSLFMISIAGDKPAFLGEGKDRQANCTSPALVDGRLFCRLPKRIACYDLRP